MVYNPLGISIEKLDVMEGTITFVTRESNLFDEASSSIRMLEISKDQTVFVLERDSDFNIKFIQSNPNYETKIAKINIRGFQDAPKLFFALMWSRDHNSICIGDYRSEVRSAVSFEHPYIKFRVGKDGVIYQIGDDGVKVVLCRVKIGKGVVLDPAAKESFDFQIGEIKSLIENCKKSDFQLESTLARQAIVMLTTAFEMYAKTRFVELEREGVVVNMERLYINFISKKYRKEFERKTKEAAIKKGRTELDVFIEKKSVNFQNWKSFKDAYNKGYGMKVGGTGISNDILIGLQKFIKWRHEIIHSKGDQTMINFEDVPPAEPIFINKDLADEGLNIFQRFINEFHKSTLDL